MLRVLALLLVASLLVLSRAAVIPTESDAVSPAADSESMQVSTPEKDIMPEGESEDEMDAQDWMMARPYFPWMYNTWVYRPWLFPGRRIFFPLDYRHNYMRLYDEEGSGEESPKLSKRDSEVELQRNEGLESAIIAAQSNQVKLHILISTYPSYFHRFYRPVYNRFCYAFPRLYRQNPVSFRLHFPVLYRYYTSPSFVPITPVSRFVLASEDDEDPESIEPQNQLTKRDEAFEAEDVSFFCVRALAGQISTAPRVLDRCRDVLGLPFFGDHHDTMRYDFPDLGSSIRSEVYSRLGRSFREAMAQNE